MRTHLLYKFLGEGPEEKLTSNFGLLEMNESLIEG